MSRMVNIWTGLERITAVRASSRAKFEKITLSFLSRSSPITSAKAIE